MKHLTWLVSALTLAGVADDAETWVYDTTARAAPTRSVAACAAGSLETRTASAGASASGGAESRVKTVARSAEGGLDATRRVGLRIFVR